jgi:hypothetical protein
MLETRRTLLAALAAAGSLAIVGAGSLSGQSKSSKSSRPSAPDPNPDADDPPSPNAKSPTKVMLDANEKDIKKNIDKLYQLATDLKEEVEKTDSSKVMSLAMIKKADEIEHLAHDIKIRAKG